MAAVSTPAFPPQRVEGAVAWALFEETQLVGFGGTLKDWAGALMVMVWELPLGHPTDSCITMFVTDSVVDVESGSVIWTS